MGKHLVQRVALAVPLILLVSFMTFAIMRLLPGDPALAALGGQAASPEAVDELRNELGLDKPFYVQYADFLMGAVQGDFGRSLRTGTRVTEEIRTTLPATAKLAASGLAVAVLIGVPLGVVAALKRNTVVDWFAVLLSTLGISVPTFWLGLALISLFSFRWGLLPAGGGEGWRTLVLPAVTLGTGGAAIIARMTRSSLVEVLRQDYILTARAKGLGDRIVVGRHALRNALIPVLTTVGLQVGARADIVTLDTTHPSLAGRRGDAVIDGWIFAASAGAVDCVWAGGNKVVEGGHHRLRQQAREKFSAAIRRLVA